eukprot:5645-Heterococcus_DN1.PRE.1
MPSSEISPVRSASSTSVCLGSAASCCLVFTAACVQQCVCVLFASVPIVLTSNMLDVHTAT